MIFHLSVFPSDIAHLPAMMILSPRYSTITEQECLSHFQNFIEKEKPGLTVFYDGDALYKRAIVGTEMSNQLCSRGWPMETAKNLAVLTLYDVALFIGLSSQL